MRSASVRARAIHQPLDYGRYYLSINEAMNPELLVPSTQESPEHKRLLHRFIILILCAFVAA